MKTPKTPGKARKAAKKKTARRRRKPRPTCPEHEVFRVASAWHAQMAGILQELAANARRVASAIEDDDHPLSGFFNFHEVNDLARELSDAASFAVCAAPRPLCPIDLLDPIDAFEKVLASYPE